ncbi:hypothetical protein ACIP39_00055 [Streptomyces tibetensis]|uniref:hypothetical protein n=1 Tax=Streptomyces tibetensis TaxID=2382123 RepID=UPI003800615D
MTAVLFVHGTGVRKTSFDTTLDTISRSLRGRRPSLTVHGCFWGGRHGSTLYARGASVPVADGARSIGSPGVPDELDVLVWDRLQDDALFELRLLTLGDASAPRNTGFHPRREPTGEALRNAYSRFAASDETEELFNGAGLAGQFADACHTIASSEVFGELEAGGAAAADVWPAVVRATVAEAIRRAEREDAPYLPVVYDRQCRDTFVNSLIRATVDDHRSVIGGWAKQRAGSFFASTATTYVSRRRGAFTDSASLVAGDILLYQRDGDAMRRFVADHISALEPPVTVVAHSLGGIMCVDLLATTSLPGVRLVTVGTAAPLFWELDALRGLRAGAPLPPGFPEWTNVYDQRDFLAYVAAPVFGDRVRDVRVDNGLPFPRCHSAYWFNSRCRDTMLGACP